MKVLNIKLHKPKPVYRTYIKKKNGKLRPLGIPPINDRVYQNMVKMALEPQWEELFEPTSYGFRPKQSCHDAIERIFKGLMGGKKQWIFEGDFKGCFDHLNHDYILEQVKSFPASNLIHKWLKAGFVDNQVFQPTEEGTPQEGLCKALHRPPYAKKITMQSNAQEARRYGISVPFTLHSIPGYSSESQESSA